MSLNNLKCCKLSQQLVRHASFKSIAEVVRKLPTMQVYHISVFFVCLKIQ